MQTLKEVKIEMYENMKDRYNDFLWEEERYIVENLKSEEDTDKPIVVYTEDVACDIVCQSLDWLCMTDTENACWEAWYIRWYEVVLRNLIDLDIKNISDLKDQLNYLLNN